jgi:hypothetical protein
MSETSVQNQKTTSKSPSVLTVGFISGLLSVILFALALIAPFFQAYHLDADFSGTASDGSSAYQLIFGLAYSVSDASGVTSARLSAPLGWSLAQIVLLGLSGVSVVAAFVLSLLGKKEKIGTLYTVGAVVGLISGLVFLFVSSKELSFQLDGGKEAATAISIEKLRDSLTLGQGFLLVGPLAVFASLFAFVSVGLSSVSFAEEKAKFVSFFAPKGVEKEMMRYSDNGVSSTLGYLGIILLAAGFCFLYSTTTVNGKEITIFGLGSNGLWVALDVFLNIVLLLALFLAITAMKAYSKRWGIISIVIGVFMLIRPFFYPLALLQFGILKQSDFVLVTVFFLISGVSLVLAGVAAIYRGKALRAYLSTVKDSIEGEKGGVR